MDTSPTLAFSLLLFAIGARARRKATLTEALVVFADQPCWGAKRPAGKILLAVVFGIDKNPLIRGRGKVGIALALFSIVRSKKGISRICRNGPAGASHKLDLSPFSTH
jgi:hypothetical protein